MDTKRWSTLWVFVAGCLTGAVSLGLHSAGTRLEVSSSRGDAEDVSEPAAPIAVTNRVEERVASKVEPPVTQPPAPGATEAVAAPQVATPQTDAADAGNSVGEVLAQLEAEYRRQSATSPSEPARAELPERTRAVADVPAAAELPTGEPRVAAAPPPPAAPAPAAAVAATTVEPKASPPVERVVYVREVRDEPPPPAPPQQVAGMQQNLVVHQAALVQQQQAALVQYYQLLALPPVAASESRESRWPKPSWKSQSSYSSGSISSLTPSSISATANPWGFVYKPTELVR